ncbi:MAG: PIN domain-containing protein [Candidatus Omnitrophica bacterium]|nr:PIN domain-containing protein [Candidatus Omnitrophota bacterium]MBI2173885.1 PIN domain-containing protein [Candidatus Omnitrophota bacterium]MBI3009857.1 PIN domain-containing protein [Candidatus Omnitrophota bacterium]
MTKCFIDTSAFAALYHRNDAYHEQAKQIWTFLRQRQAILYTTRDVISETITLVRRRTSYRQAVICGNDLWASPVLEILRSDARQDSEAWEFFQRYTDKEFSFVDCLSFVLMKELRLQWAFAFDQHFAQAGFEMIQPESSY